MRFEREEGGEREMLSEWRRIEKGRFERGKEEGEVERGRKEEEGREEEEEEEEGEVRESGGERGRRGRCGIGEKVNQRSTYF